MESSHSNKFFLISFLPALAYWYLESHYSLKVALFGGLVLAILEIGLEKVFTKHVHSISKLNFFLIVFLAMISFIGDEGIWFKLQPFFTGLFMGGLLIYKTYKNDSYFLEMMEAMNRPIPSAEIIKYLEKHTGFFMLGYGLFMAYVAFEFSTEKWLFFKTIGFYICFILFFIGEMFLLRKKAMSQSKIIKNQ